MADVAVASTAWHNRDPVKTNPIVFFGTCCPFAMT